MERSLGVGSRELDLSVVYDVATTSRRKKITTWTASGGASSSTFGSTCHGAGRLLSRTAAVKAARGRSIGEELRQRGVLARATGRDALAEEMPEAYKDVNDVVDVVHRFGISTRVARLKPLAVGSRDDAPRGTLARCPGH